MGAKIGYYIFIFPLSYLPLTALYLMTDIFYLLLISIVPYRKKVILSNIERSFPDKSHKEHKKLMRQFYRHLTDLLAEGVKNLSISERELQQRFVVNNPEVMQTLFEQEKSVILVSGHYNNWEWLITAQNKLFPHQAYGIGMPLSSQFWHKKVNARRERLGMRVIHAKKLQGEVTAKTQGVKSSISTIRSVAWQFLKKLLDGFSESKHSSIVRDRDDGERTQLCRSLLYHTKNKTRIL